MDPKSILDAVWKNVGEGSGQRWLTVAITPALVFWIACGVVYYGVVFDWNQTSAWWSVLSDAQRAFLLMTWAGLIVLTAFAIDVIGESLLRLAEGYWEDIPLVGKRLQSRIRERFTKPHIRWNELSKKLMARDHPELWTGRNQVLPSPITQDEEKEFNRLDRQLHDLPPRDQLTPTILGNLLRAAEWHALSCYGLDSVVVWSRLYPLLSDALREQLDNARTVLDASVRLMFMAIVFSGVWVIGGVMTRSWNLAFVVLGGLIFVWLTWSATISAGATYGELIRSAFDLHRFDLYEAFHLDLPTNTGDERQLGEQLSKLLWRHQDMEYQNKATRDDFD